jgi:hypothetical protein
MSTPHLAPLPDQERSSAVGSIKRPSPERPAITRLPKPAAHVTTLEPQGRPKAVPLRVTEKRLVKVETGLDGGDAP